MMSFSRSLCFDDLFCSLQGLGNAFALDVMMQGFKHGMACRSIQFAQFVPECLLPQFCPPSCPPSGPISMIQSAVLTISMLCSITRTVLPLSTNSLQNFQEMFDIMEMKSSRGLIKDIQSIALWPDERVL